MFTVAALCRSASQAAFCSSARMEPSNICFLRASWMDARSARACCGSRGDAATGSSFFPHLIFLEKSRRPPIIDLPIGTSNGKNKLHVFAFAVFAHTFK